MAWTRLYIVSALSDLPDAQATADRLLRNQDDIGNWPLGQVKMMMRMHLDQTIAEATHRLQNNHMAEINDYDAIEDHRLKLADTLATGIAAQHPDKVAEFATASDLPRTD